MNKNNDNFDKLNKKLNNAEEKILAGCLIIGVFLFISILLYKTVTT